MVASNCTKKDLEIYIYLLKKMIALFWLIYLTQKVLKLEN